LNIQLQWVDINDDVVSLSASALVAKQRLLPSDFDSNLVKRIYAGRFDRDAITERLISILYKVFELAQIASEQSLEKPTSIGIPSEI
jgi:hypothetical protein